MNTSKAISVGMSLALLLGSVAGLAQAQDPVSKFTPVEAAYCEERFSEIAKAESSASAALSLKDSAAAVYKSCDSEALDEPQDRNYTFRIDFFEPVR